jgi:hypothetical protein
VEEGGKSSAWYRSLLTPPDMGAKLLPASHESH